MNSKATVNINRSGASPADELKSAKHRRPHPMDNWLKRELESLYVDMESHPLPSGLAELAAALEEKLKSAKSRNKKPEPN
jgi:hypothetical protein